MRLQILKNPVPAIIADGELSSEGARMLRVAVENALATDKKSIGLDLSGVRYLNSDGMHAIVYAHRAVRARGGSLGIVLRPGAVRDLVRGCGLAYQPEVEVCESIVECTRRLSTA